MVDVKVNVDWWFLVICYDYYWFFCGIDFVCYLVGYCSLECGDEY